MKVGSALEWSTPHFASAISAFVLLAALAGPSHAGANAVSEFQRAAYGGDFSGGIANLQAMSDADPNDVEAVFATGTLQFFKAFANFQQGLYEHTGEVRVSNTRIPLLGWRIPFAGAMTQTMVVPPNPNARPMTYTVLRKIMERFYDDVSVAEKTLARVGNRHVKLPVQVFKISFDLNHDNQITEDEKIIPALLGMRQGRVRTRALTVDEIVFDTADASWLRGYSNLFMASANLFLAFDFEKTYEATAHNIYGYNATHLGRNLEKQQKLGRGRETIQAEIDVVEAKKKALVRPTALYRKRTELRKKIRDLQKTPETEEERNDLQTELNGVSAEIRKYSLELNKLNQERKRLITERDGSQFGTLLDLVALVHSISWPVIEPERFQSIRKHLLRVFELNKATWELVRQETDDDGEWLPNPTQTSSFGGRRISDSVINSWLATTELGEQLLNGEKLLPHPRFKMGFNLKKFFETAERLDVVLLITGHDAVPYLEKGEIVDHNAWRTITSPMGRNMLMYAVWFN